MKKNALGIHRFRSGLAWFVFFMLVWPAFFSPGEALAISARQTGKKASFEEIEHKVREWMKAGEIPGLTLVLVREEEPVFIKGYGFAELDSGTAVTPDTLFELGSCTKSFTALAVLSLESQGLIRPDALVSDYLPWFYAVYHERRTGITVQQLLHHTSGIPPGTLSAIPAGTGSTALQQTVKNLAGVKLKHAPGSYFQYATINYDILGAVIEKVSGQSFETYLEEKIFAPLGLTASFVSEEQSGDPSLLASGYKQGFFRPRKYTPPVFRANNPAAYMVASGRGVAQWLRYQLNLDKTGFAPLIEKSHVPDLTVPPSGDMTSYGMGWHINQYRETKIYHLGLNPTFSAYMGFYPRERIGAAVLVNCSTPFTRYIGESVLELLAGREISSAYPQANKADAFCSIVCMVLAVYLVWMAVVILLRLSGYFRGKNKCEPLTREKIRRITVALLLSVPFLYGIYLLPEAIAHLTWKTALVWAPISFGLLIVLLLSAIGLSYLQFILTLLLPGKSKYRNEIPLLVVTSVLSGMGGTAVLFIVTTAFFSTVAVGYLLYYFGLTYFLTMFGRKIIQGKMIEMANNIGLDLRIDLINKLCSSKYQHFEKLHDGRIFATLNSDTGVLAGSASLVVNFVTSVITTISAFIYMTTISLLSTLVVLATTFILILYYRWVSIKSRVFMETARDALNVYMSLLNSLIRGFKELSLHRGKKIEFKEDLIDSSRISCIKSIQAGIKFLNANIVGDSIFLIILGILSIVISRLVTGVDAITLISFVMVILFLRGPIRAILGIIPSLTELQVAWGRIKGFVKDLEVEKNQDSVREFVRNIDLRKEPGEETNLREPGQLARGPWTAGSVENIKVEGLMFHYESREEEQGFTLGPIDFEVKKGEILFIVGGNGSGKTTLAKLLTGLYLNDKGSIKLNGEEMQDTRIGEFFSTIFSNYHLFNKLYNIDLRSKDNLIQDYLTRLDLHHKVQVKDGRYSTLELSGGQRKRLALFQCYLEDRPIFLFDELAADQDPEFRKFFYRELLVDMKAQGKIVIAITHDDHYFDAADMIIKLDMGSLDAASHS
jgi:putative ATP-binding cassette transporter